MFTVVRRATLLFPSPSARDKDGKHLFTVLTDPCGPANQVLMVGIATLRDKGCDMTCVLKRGDHEFIKVESYVAYSFCRVEWADKLAAGVQKGTFVDKGLLDEKIFDRVLAGLRKSRSTKPFAIQFIDECARHSKK